MVVSKVRFEASLCRDSFFDFVQRFWGEIIPEPPVWNWHIAYLCEELQKMAERVFERRPKLYDLVINISPGTTKSTICSIMFPAWCWTRDPTIHIICGSYAFPLGLYLGALSRRVIQSDKYLELFPEIGLIEEVKSLLTNGAGGQRITTSTGGSITGMHGHLIIVDDPINPKEAVSKTMLRTANDWFDHTLMTRKIDRAVTPTILIMQRLHQSDPSGHMLEKAKGKGIRHICLPAVVSKKVHPEALKEQYLGGLFDPERLSAKILVEAERELGQYAFAGQFMQDPIPEGGGMFRVDMLRIEGSVSRLTNVVRYWDKAGTHGGGAYTVGVKMGVDIDKRFVVMDVTRGQWEAAARERIILQTAVMDGKGVLVFVEQEPGSGGKESAQATVKNLAGFRVRMDRPTGDKETRADPFAVQVNGGNVTVLNRPWLKDYLEELRFFPLGTHKDQVDASSGAFAMLTRRVLVLGALR